MARWWEWVELKNLRINSKEEIKDGPKRVVTERVESMMGIF